MSTEFTESAPNNKVTLMLFDAKNAITKNPTDIAHNWENHHLPVLENIKNIVEGEGLKDQINYPALLVAGAWHDYKRHSGDFTDMEMSLVRNGADLNFINVTKDIINEHSFNDKRVSLEGKILWAADKIEYVSKDRFITACNTMPRFKILAYQTLWKTRLPAVIIEFENCNLPVAKNIFDAKFKELTEYVQKNNHK